MQQTSYQVLCLSGCEPMPRLDLPAARRGAAEHAEEHGHACDIVRIIKKPIERVWPSAAAIGAGG